ncbi:hypothetical protein C8R45DRAFT_1224531 [Mycena sanguinolenta]|nr:hypothetical protein C8R45DRAFT_1224531 [Mycena sanguinolenta]
MKLIAAFIIALIPALVLAAPAPGHTNIDRTYVDVYEDGAVVAREPCRQCNKNIIAANPTEVL